jgi:hypothetical protein
MQDNDFFLHENLPSAAIHQDQTTSEVVTGSSSGSRAQDSLLEKESVPSFTSEEEESEVCTTRLHPSVTQSTCLEGIFTLGRRDRPHNFVAMARIQDSPAFEPRCF